MSTNLDSHVEVSAVACPSEQELVVGGWSAKGTAVVWTGSGGLQWKCRGGSLPSALAAMAQRGIVAAWAGSGGL